MIIHSQKIYWLPSFVLSLAWVDFKTASFFIDCGFKTIDCQTGNGAAYRGNVSQTVSGLECQAWNVKVPHTHSYGSVGSHNYCRNPDGEEDGVWCFTNNKYKRRDYCDVRRCVECDQGKTSTISIGSF